MKKEIRELNAPAIDLIADILHKHVDAILSEVRIRFKQIKEGQSSEADRQSRDCGQCVPLSTDGKSVFIDGVGEVPLDFGGQARGEPVAYHPCTPILIEGLKRLPGGSAILAEWDKARSKVDAPQPAEPVKLCDCERGHNGMGMAGRECDCPGNNPQPAEPVKVPSGTKEDTSGG